MKKIKVATVFSGIGAFEFALKRLKIPNEIIFACDNGGRIIDYDYDKEIQIVKSLKNSLEKKKYVDELYKSNTRRHNFVKDSFLANYSMDENKFYEDIRLLDGNDFTDQVDILVGGSPCQSFSSVGYKKGLEDARGTLFFDFIRLINEIKPRIFIYENVRGIKNHDHGNTWEIMSGLFKDTGYKITSKLLNAKDFGVPQNRARMFVIGIKDQNDFSLDNINIDLKYKMQDFLIDHCSFGNFTYDKSGELVIHNNPGEIGSRYYLSEKIKKYVLKSGTKSFYQKPVINKEIARTILSTMGNCHRAGIDNYVDHDGQIRMLSEREALRLMGFTDDFRVVVSVAQMYKQAGNSIVVDVLIGIVRELFNQNIL